MKTIKTGIEYSFELPDGYQFVDENGNVINATKIVLEKKKPKYLSKWEDCLNAIPHDEYFRLRGLLYDSFLRLICCRNAYWKLAGDWKPDWEDVYSTKWIIITSGTMVRKAEATEQNYILAFPTEEMRDAFYENFKELIEQCKELL